MMIRRTMAACLAAVILAVGFYAAALADDIKERMLQRLPVIAELKIRGVIGEDNRGYLGFVSEAKENQELIEAENADREKVYQLFARQQNTTLALVEQVQAARKAERAKPGEFYQTPEGQWVKK